MMSAGVKIVTAHPGRAGPDQLRCGTGFLCGGCESKAELIVLNGVVVEIRYGSVVGRMPLSEAELRFFQEVVLARATDIVTKWIDFFVMHKPIKSETITRRLK